MPKGTFGGSSFTYGVKNALAFNPLNNSLFITGHDHQQMVAEVSIPNPIVTSQEGNLPTATVLQPFADASDGKMFTVDSGTIKVGGLLAVNNKLYGTAYSYYDASGDQTLSHFSSSQDLSKQGDAQGMYKVGTEKTGYVSGYMTPIPTEWQTSFGGPAITGNCCLSIISRTSYGPAAFVFDPAKLGQQSPVPAAPLVYYPSSHPLAEWSSTSPHFNGTTKISAIVFPKNSRSLLFLGRHGTGAWCYGTGGTGGECNDPTSTNKGNHAYPYVNQIWAYDALDLLKVKEGNKSPWEINPYQTWQFTLPFQTEGDSPISGGTYDPSTQRIFISHDRGSSPLIIHVYKLNLSTTNTDTTPPAQPKNLELRIIP
ncbi:MAG: hypothetical protein NPIRA03_10150 [Nitrospirales bacterium]|nr:MAG: hypothetical protein NPIRA03_10150 [Nitrospirales bacterium]